MKTLLLITLSVLSLSQLANAQAPQPDFASIKGVIALIPRDVVKT